MLKGQIDLTTGSIGKKLIIYSAPLMIGNILQQLYNFADTLIVGRFIGNDALAAVGSAYTLMVLIISIVSGLCMGCSTYTSIALGASDFDNLKQGVWISFLGTSIFSVLLTLILYISMPAIIKALQIPFNIRGIISEYLYITILGIIGAWLYNFYASELRAIGSSFIPLVFLAISSVINIILDILFVAVLNFGVGGAALATVISQYFSGIALLIYVKKRYKILKVEKKHKVFSKKLAKRLFNLSALTCLQQSIMNFGILMVQGRVNTFGPVVMAAFTASVKIDTLAYAPLQDFGNAFSTFIAQNNGANKQNRIQEGTKISVIGTFIFSFFISIIVFAFAPNLLSFFTDSKEIISIGTTYLRIEGVWFCLIGWLFLFYAFFRGIEKPLTSVVLTITSLGTRIILSYSLSAIPAISELGIWVSIPIGWALADLLGLAFYKKSKIKHI